VNIRYKTHILFSVLISFFVLSLSPLETADAFVLDGQTEEWNNSDKASSRDPLTQPLVAVESVPSEVSLDIPEIPNTRSVWEELLQSADDSIKMGLYYYTSRDNTALERLGQLLRERADDGVHVEVVSDSVFFEQYPDELNELASHSNADVHILDLEDQTGGVMHAKYFVVDEESYYAGSANFSWKTLKHNRELGLAGTNSDVAERILEVFKVDWKSAGPDSPSIEKMRENFSDRKPPHETTEDTPPWIDEENFTAVTASPPKLTPPTIRSDLETLVGLIDSAENKIFVDIFQYGLTSPYSETNLHDLDFALRRAAQRGVKVNLMVSDWSLEDPQRSHLESLRTMPNINVRAIGFPIHTSGYFAYARTSHPKMILVDSRYAWVGSANWQPGYFTNSRNLGIVTNHSTVTKDLKKFFLTAWTSRYSQDITGSTSKKKPSVPYHW